MALENVAWSETEIELAPEAEALIQEADRRIDLFLGDAKGRPGHGFVPSDYRKVYRLLTCLMVAKQAPGPNLCEWGSGFGVVTALAAGVGFDAFGIEHSPKLVEQAEELAAAFDVAVKFICASYVPAGFDFYTDAIGDSSQLMTRTAEPAADSWEAQSGLTMEDVDVVFVYPWPREAQFIEELFDAAATEGTLLVFYHGDDDVQVKRKVGADDLADDDA